MSGRLVGWALGIWTVGLAAGWVVAYLDHSSVMLPLGPPEVLFMAVGGFLIVKRSGGLIGPLMVVGGSAGLLYDLGTVYAGVSQSQTPTLPLEHLAAWLGSWTGPLAFICIPLLLVLYPQGTFRGGRVWWLPIAALFVGSTLVGAMLMWTAPTSVLVAFGSGEDPSGYPAYELINVGFLSWYLFIPAALTLAHRYWRGSNVERLQVGWLLASVLVLPPLAVIADRVGVDGTFLLAITPCAIPIAIGIAITRYRLYDLGQVVSRTVTYALVVGLLALVFVFGALWVPQALGIENPLFVAATTLGVAAAFNPLRRQTQGLIDRWFNRSRYDAEHVMDEFAGSLRDRVDTGEVVDGWVGVVSATMQPSRMSVWVRDE